MHCLLGKRQYSIIEQSRMPPSARIQSVTVESASPRVARPTHLKDGQ